MRFWAKDDETERLMPQIADSKWVVLNVEPQVV